MSLPGSTRSDSVCVTGVPASGLRLSASILRAGGVSVEAAAFAKVNEQVLASLGGSWQFPPSLGGSRREALRHHLDTARQFAAGVHSDGATVWVDSQVLLLADLWREVDPALRFVIAIRNPLETILSLRQRHGIELDQGFALCLAHLRCAAELIPAEQRIVVHYDACLLDPGTQAARLFAYVGARVTGNLFAEAVSVSAPERRRFRASVLDLAAARPPRELLDLYGFLCLEAGYHRDADVLEATFGGRPTDDDATATAMKRAQIVRIAELADEREQFRLRVRASEGRCAAAQAQVERLMSEVAEAQRAATEQMDGVESLRSVIREAHPGAVLDRLDQGELVSWAAGIIEERQRLHEANAALLEELNAVNRHREELVANLNEIWNSESWKLGRAVTWPVRFALRREMRGRDGSTTGSFSER